MNGVMIPETPAGSNHIGASETCTPQISCPSVPAAIAEPGAPATTPSAAAARRSRRLISVAPPPDGEFPRPFAIIVIGRLLSPLAAGIPVSVDERLAASLRRELHTSCVGAG